jgi:hypothetical protein
MCEVVSAGENNGSTTTYRRREMICRHDLTFLL